MQITEGSLKSFLTMYTQNQLRPAIRSDEVPAVLEKKGLVTLVGKNVNDYVRSKQNVILLVYVSWCGHCQAILAPYKEIAAKVCVTV